MPPVSIEEVKSQLSGLTGEVKQSIEKLQQASTEFKAYNDRLEKVEKKTGHIPADMEEKLGKIDSAVESFESKTETITKSIETLESKLNEFEEAETKRENSGDALDKKHQEAFTAFARYGVKQFEDSKGADHKELEDLQQKAMYAGSDPDGGYVVPRPMSNLIITAMRDATPFRENADSTTVSGDTFSYLIDLGEAGSGWTAERAARQGTDTPQLYPAKITVHEMYANPALTQQILDDAAFNIEAWLSNKVAEKFADMEAEAFLLGDGVGKPRGVLTYPDGTDTWNTIEQISSGAATSITPDSLYELQDALKEKFASSAKWYMNRRTVSFIRRMKDADGQYLWQPSLQVKTPPTLLGDPIVRMNYMPTVAAGALAMMYGALNQAYLIVDRLAIRVLRDPYTQTPYVLFKTNKRVGGDVVNFEAVKLMKVEA